jgi:hypothetical protein
MKDQFKDSIMYAEKLLLIVVAMQHVVQQLLK